MWILKDKWLYHKHGEHLYLVNTFTKGEISNPSRGIKNGLCMHCRKSLSPILLAYIQYLYPASKDRIRKMIGIKRVI